MFKRFDPPLTGMTERKAREQFPGKAYLFADVEEIIEEQNGAKVHKGIKGALYAISDETIEDMDKYYSELKELSSRGLFTSTSDDFELRDTILW